MRCPRSAQVDRWRTREGAVSTVDRIREKIRRRDYFVSSHAEEEMAEDGFERSDVERAVLEGRIDRKLTHDRRGTRYRIEGAAGDGRIMHVLCRFREDRSLIIITVYEKGEADEM